jgi:hypothetical protein
MKYYRYLFVAILALSTNAYAFQPKIEIIEQFDNLKMVAFISAKDIANSPEWNPDLDSPPLSVSEAIKAVKKFNRSSKSSGNIREIEIRQVPHHKTKWHYLVKVTNDAMKTKTSIYVVLMNGKVIPAIIEPEGYK